ncbi:MAG TPA: bifunctional diaminohydroxyphosphoribosylaminopyrimidine deaminase/5-amino-6-(5-phosphoribosylamino)uracil reductase RibD [Alphaproteobacteria bacterium]|nr:bifunctional diaminohydroxyphosphoribosylaminopyrimidine deaminase/5-amino-6-(5-phosphoribosylamino)uracil reductase RibD [Alphaproteobacteria bacterium]
MVNAEADRRFMAAALGLARRGLGNVWPNPAVGCVLVKDGHVVGRGWTQPGGRPHAETEALARAGKAARGATAYVTLEPCSHHGHTGPCAEALIAAGVARVVVAIGDPDPRVAGQGLATLRKAGIAAELGLLAEQAAAINRGYLIRAEAGQPMVTLKLATTLDGRIAAHTGDSHWITGEPARAAAHGLRASHDAIAVGIGTAVTDDPSLTCRLPGMPVRPPIRIVFDTRLQLPLTLDLIATAREVPTWIVTLEAMMDLLPAERIETFQSLGVEIIPVAARETGRLSIAAALTAFAERGLTRLLVEGGGRLAASFIDEKLVDALVIFRSGIVLGGDAIPAVAGLGLETIADAPGFRLVDSRQIGEDRIESYVLAPAR